MTDTVFPDNLPEPKGASPMMPASPVVLAQQIMASSDDSGGPNPLGALAAILLVVGIVFGFRALSQSAWKARRAQLSSYAAQQGWTYQPNASQWSRVFTPRPFDAGVNRKARDLLSGTTASGPFVSFEYLYIDKNIGYDPGGRGEAARTYFFSVVAVKVGWEIPRTEFIPEGITQKVAKALGGDDLDVESDAFNKKWRIRTLDKRAAHALLTPKMIERLLTDDFAGKPFFLERGYVVHFHEGPRSENEVESMLDVCSNFLDLVPDFVRQDYTR